MQNPAERLASEADAKSWLDKYDILPSSIFYDTNILCRTVASYAQARGVTLSGRDASQGQSAAANLVDSAALLALQNRHDTLITRNIKVLHLT